jgi:NhaP-type Na+/H+ or K+/H+ antiporter
MVHGNGFIAAWVAGLVLGHLIRSTDVHVQTFSLDLGKILVMLSFVVFGALLLAPALSDLSWDMALYALLSLVLIRPVAVAISMLRSGRRAPTVAYLGWFGPRGIASIILALIVIKKFALFHEDLIVLIMTFTVAASVYLHGITAWPGSNAYANWYQANSATGEAEPVESET